MSDWTARYQASEGQIWVCGACGRSGPNRATIGDESCFMRAILCRDDETLKRNGSGLVVSAVAIDESVRSKDEC